MDTPLPHIAATTTAAHDMLPQGAVVLAMVSGGADSVALLRLLASGALGEHTLSVLHVDHMLRGTASDGDAASVERVCSELGVPCRVVRYDVGAYAEAEGLNLEDAGRRVRYRFAEEELDARCADAGERPSTGRIAVAHTFDDRMETFLMRLATGSGPGGLTAIQHVRGRIVRPMLDARRADVIAYLASLGQTWREDETNADTTRLRARVRAELLPLLEGINPRFDEALARTFRVLADDEELLESMAGAFGAGFTQREGDDLFFDRKRMQTLSASIMRRAIRTALQDAFPETSRIEFEHVEAIAAGMADDGFARDLPGGIRAFSEYDTLVVSRAADAAPALAPSLLEVPGRVDMGPAGVLTAEIVLPESFEVGEDIALLDASLVIGPLIVDSVRPGDRMRPFGMQGTRKLQDLLTDAKVPRRLRPVTPVVRDGEAIVWLAGVRASEEYRIGPQTTNAIRLTWTGPPEAEDAEA